MTLEGVVSASRWERRGCGCWMQHGVAASNELSLLSMDVLEVRNQVLTKDGVSICILRQCCVKLIGCCSRHCL